MMQFKPSILEKRATRRGFTLPEVLVSAGIAGVIAAAVMLSFVAFQKCYELSMARSGVRSNVVRLFDALEIDLRNAKTVTAAVSGGVNVFPLTLTIPQRYSDYEATGPMAGDPGREATRLPPEFDPKTGKLVFPNSITVTYSLVANGPSTRNLTRDVSWTAVGGGAKTASRVVATVPADTTITFRSPSGGVIGANDEALIGSVSAQSNSKIGRDSAPITLAGTVFLRMKSLQ